MALSSGQVDVAWMGPWGYVIAHNQGAGDVIATAKYNGKPVYHAIVIARPDIGIEKWPMTARGFACRFRRRLHFGLADSDVLVQVQGIDPKTYFQYHEGSTHPANEIAVANGQSDLATDFDRNRTAMIENGAISPTATKIVWTSDDLPNDAIAVRAGLDPAIAEKIRAILIAVTDDQAKKILPKHYTGFMASSDTNYRLLRDAGLAVGALKSAK